MKKFLKGIRFYLRPLRAFYGECLGHIALKKLDIRLRSELHQEKHNLEDKLIVSLTSYAPRFLTLMPTLQCLLTQTIKPDHLILWISHNDQQHLPDDIKNLENKGLEIKTTDDIRSYKKIIPCLKEFPEATIVTADDDVSYETAWLEQLINQWDGNKKHIVAHKVRKILFDTKGEPLPYNNWQWHVKSSEKSDFLFPVGYGGVLYPPGSLTHVDALNQDLFMELAPHADDLWLYFMGKLNGCKYSTTNNSKNFILWPCSQTVSLTSNNSAQSGNDIQIQNLIQHYGTPWK